MKKIQIKTTIKTNDNVSEMEITNALLWMCRNNNWSCEDWEINQVETKKKVSFRGSYYFGTNKKIESIKKGMVVTPSRDLAIAYAHKPKNISIDNKKVYHDGKGLVGYLYKIDEPLVVGEDIFQYYASKFDDGYEMLTKRELKIKLVKVIGEKNEKVSK